MRLDPRQRNSAVASIAAHAAVVGLALLWKMQGAPLRSVLPHEVEVKWGTPHGASSQAAPLAHAPRGGGGRSSAKGARVRLRSFGIVLPRADQTNSGRGSAEGDAARESGHGAGSGDGYDYARGMTLQREGETYPFYDAIWRKVDRVLTYPSELVDRRREGTVTVQVGVDRRGVFDGRVIEVASPDPLLKTYVLAILIHALHKPLPENAWAHGERAILVGRFDFKTYGPGGAPQAAPEVASHFKNLLTFERRAYVDPALNQAIEKFFTRVMPPIIPFPGGVYVDFIRAYQWVRSFSEPDPDQIATAHMDSVREQWERMIVTSSSAARADP